MLVFRAQFHKCNCWYLELNFTNVTVAIGAWSVVPLVVWALEEDDTVWRTDPIGVTRAPVCPGETLRMSLPHKLSVPWCVSPAYPIVTGCVFYQYNVTSIYHYYLLYFFFYLDKNVINTYTKKKDFTNRVLYSLLREVMIFIRIEGDININFAFWSSNKLGIICVINEVCKKGLLSLQFYNNIFKHIISNIAFSI